MTACRPECAGLNTKNSRNTSSTLLKKIWKREARISGQRLVLRILSQRKKSLAEIKPNNVTVPVKPDYRRDGVIEFDLFGAVHNEPHFGVCFDGITDRVGLRAFNVASHIF